MAWAEYREQLRDLSFENIDPASFVFPNKPE